MKTTTIPAIWQTYNRADLSQAQKMIDAGFEVQFDRDDIVNNRLELPHNNISFVMGIMTVWKVSNWITADLINGHYINHTHYDSLDEILESFIGKLEFKFYDIITLPYYNHDDMSGGSWLTNDKIFIYVNATWNFYDDEIDTHGVEVMFKNEKDEYNDSLPKKQFYKFAEPTNLIELANYKQFYLGLVENLTKKYFVD